MFRSAWRLSGAILFASLASDAGEADSEIKTQTAQVRAGGVLVAPTRVVFEGRQRSSQITIVNPGERSGLYRVSLVHMRMKPNGSLEQITSSLPGEQFADTLVRFSPRQLQLDPQVPQTIRLLLRVPENLPAGEYRSHLLIREIPTPGSAEDEPATIDSLGKGWQVRLRPLVGAAIPVIVRRGEMKVALSITDVSLVPPAGEDRVPVLIASFRRSGDRSVYGDVTVTLSSESGRSTVVGGIQGMAVYTPDSVRTIRIPLHRMPKEAPPAGRLNVAFSEPNGSEVPLATASLEAK